MIRQIRTFQAVVRCGSFSRAADELHISQSAVSQQIQALENDLGFPLLARKNRSFTLTAAGEYFYHKSLVLIADFDRMCREAAGRARGGAPVFRIGVLRGMTGGVFGAALSAFSADFPEVSVEVVRGSHEELFAWLRTDRIDIAVNDQRRAFSSAYVNRVLAVTPCAVEIPARSPLAALSEISAGELKNTPCILVASREQRGAEAAYWETVMDVASPFLFAESLEEARLLLSGGRGFFIRPAPLPAPEGIAAVPLVRGGEAVTQTFCAFWKKDRPSAPSEAFADRLAARLAAR